MIWDHWNEQSFQCAGGERAPCPPALSLTVSGEELDSADSVMESGHMDAASVMEEWQNRCRDND